MKEQYINLECAILAKSLGFNEKSTHYFVLDFHSFKADGICKPFSTPVENNINIFQYQKLSDSQPHLALAPTQSLLQKWLREVYNINLTVIHRLNMSDNKEYYDYLLEKTPVVYRHFDTWENALEEGLYKALELIK